MRAILVRDAVAEDAAAIAAVHVREFYARLAFEPGEQLVGSMGIGVVQLTAALTA